MGKRKQDSEQYSERQMPSNTDAERQVLGSIMMYPECFYQAAGTIGVNDFSLSDYRIIFSSMAAIATEQKPITLETISEQLLKTHTSDAVRLLAVDLTDGLPHLKNISTYVDIVREKSRLRDLIMVMQYGSRAGYDCEPVDEVIGQIEMDLLDIMRKGRKFQQRTMREIAQDTIANLDRLRSMHTVCIGKSTGLEQLDVATTGLRNGEYYVFGARPGQGKSSLCCQSIRENSKRNIPTAFFSVEMTEDQIMQRFLAMETGMSISDLRDPRNLSKDEMLRVSRSASEIGEWPIMIDDSSRLTIQELSARARLFAAKGAEVIYVDYLQRVKGDGDKLFEQVTHVSEGLCELAKSSKIPVVALSQLRRNEESAPSLEDLRQSGQIEQDAHGVFLLWRPKKGSSYTGEDEIILSKQRDGPSGGHVNVYFHGPTASWKPREREND